MRTIEIPNELLVPAGQKAWNPGMAEINGQIFMTYRYEPRPNRWPSDLGLVCLNGKTFEVIEGTNRKLKMIRASTKVQTIDDARVIGWNGKMYLIHAQGMLNEGGKWASSVCLSQLSNSGQCNSLHVIPYGDNINLCNSGKDIVTEKNWSPFVFGHELRFLYLINPLTVIAWDGRRHREVSKQNPVEIPWWKWGNFLAGGTPLVKKGDEYIGICHTFTHEDPNRPEHRRYYGAPYAMSASEPHHLTRFASEPLMYGEFNESRDLRPDKSRWRPNVVYPMGLVDRGEHAYISYGWQDCRCEILEVNWAEINKLLTPVKSGTIVPVPTSQRAKAIPEQSPVEFKPKQEVNPPIMQNELSEDLLNTMHRILTPMDGWCTTAKGMTIAKQIERAKPKVSVEIGVFGGRSLVAMALAIRHYKQQGICMGIDPWEVDASLEAMHVETDRQWWSKAFDYQKIYDNCLNAIRAHNLQRICGVVRMRSEDAVSMFGNGQIDLLHIDGNHSEEVSMRDAALYMPKVRPGGVIIVDDINWESTVRMQEFLNAHCKLLESSKMENGGEFAVFEKNKSVDPVQEAGFGGFFRKRGRPRKEVEIV